MLYENLASGSERVRQMELFILDKEYMFQCLNILSKDSNLKKKKERIFHLQLLLSFSPPFFLSSNYFICASNTPPAISIKKIQRKDRE